MRIAMLVVLLGGCVEQVSPAGKPCPCAEGLVCCDGVCQTSCTPYGGGGAGGGGTGSGMEPPPPPVDGPGAVETILATGQDLPTGIAVDAWYVYWTCRGSGEVLRMDKGTGAITIMASAQANPGPLTIAAGMLWWLNEGDHSLRRIRLPAEEPILVAADQYGPMDIESTATHVYWTTHGRDVDLHEGTVMRVGVMEGAVPEVLAAGLRGPGGLAIDGSDVYFTTWALDGGVFRIPATGGSPISLSGGHDHPIHLSIHGEHVYFTNYGRPLLSIAGSFQRIPKAGGPIDVEIQQFRPRPVLGLDEAVYFSTNGGIHLYADGVFTDQWYAVNHDIAYDFAVDDRYVYWVTQDDGLVVRANRHGTPP